MYEKLLLSTGGGIIDSGQQSDMDDAAVLAIGLGGTGIDALRVLKEKVYNRIRPDDPAAVVPEYSHVRFLAVDTDSNGMRNHASASEGPDGSLGEIDLATEFFDISYNDDLAALFKSKAAVLARDPAYGEWLQFGDGKIKAGSVVDGASGVRQVGRFLLIKRASDFVNRVKALLHQACAGLPSTAPVYVHIYSGVSGGTGAGTFLDVCYLIRYALQEKGVGKAKVLGYFFLPDVNMSKDGLPETTKKFVHKNGYASLQELDYCMNFEENGDSWHQVYPGYPTQPLKLPPVDLCHLVSATTSKGAVMPDGYQYAMNVVTDYTMDFLIKSDSPTSFSLDSHFSNVQTTKNNLAKIDTGSSYDYLVLGASCAVVPFKQVLTYLASEVFAGFSDVRDKRPSDAESAEFQKKIGITSDAVETQIRNGIVATQLPKGAVKAGDAFEDGEGTVVHPLEALLAGNKGVVAGNLNALSNQLTGYGPVGSAKGAATKSLIARVLDAVRGVAADPAYGPWYAAALVDGNSGKDLVSKAGEIKAYASEKASHWRYQETSFAYADYVKAQGDFKKSNRMNRGSRFKDWQGKAEFLMEVRTNVAVYEALGSLMDTFTEQLQKLSVGFLVPLRDTVGELFTTFEANHAYLESFADKSASYEVPLVTMKELMSNLQKTVRELDVPANAQKFLAMLLSEDGMKGWRGNGDEALLSHLVMRYFTDTFSEYSKKSITSYLQDKYQITNPGKLAAEVFNDIMTPLDDKADPLFWTSTGYAVDTSSLMGYVTVPASAPAIQQAANKLTLARPQLHERDTHVADRISILRCIVGVPMWGYMDIQIREKEDISGDTDPGLHLYEPAEVVDGVEPVEHSRDWRLLPSPTPLIQMDDDATYRGIRERVLRGKELYEEAEKASIIVQNSAGKYEIHVLADAFMDDVRAAYNAAKDRPNDEKLQAAGVLQAKYDNRTFENKTYPISNKSTSPSPVVQRDQRVDRFVKSPVLQGIVRRELARDKEIRDDIAALQPKPDMDLEDFEKALFTGVLVIDGRKIGFTDEFGEETVLSRPSMEHGGYLLYQALLSFKQLDTDTRKELNERVQAVLKQDNAPEESVEACRAVKKELARKKELFEGIRDEFPYEASDFKSLVRALEGALDRHARRYGITLH